MMEIEAIIFDMDGVLIDSMKYHILSWNYAFNQFDIFPSKKDFSLLEGMSYKETIDYISKKYDKPTVIAEKEKIYSIKKEKLAEIFQFEIYSQIPLFLKYLKENKIRLALVSGANKAFVGKVVDKCFKDYFEIIITGSDVKNGKPHPEPYLVAREKLDCDTENLIVIENAPLGIQSAKEANLKTFAITTTLNARYLQKADKIFPSHEELIKYIKNSTSIR